MTTRPPSSLMPISTNEGMVTEQWFRYLAALSTSSGGKAVTATVGGSPFTYTAPSAGHVLVSGGTVSAISLTRGRTTIATGMTSGFVPVSAGDAVTVTYTVAPAVTFLPT